ncbi:MAG: hypothetical protein R2706_15435 [Acidimicrobiales bacterium]
MRKTTACRLVNGENDGYPGLVADLYNSTLVVKLYSTAWFPHLAAVLRPLVEQLGDNRCERVVLRPVGSHRC